MRPLDVIDADIAAAWGRYRPVNTHSRTDWRQAESAHDRLGALLKERAAVVAAQRAAARKPIERPAKGVTTEQARAATHVNVGGVWKPIVAWNPKSVVVLWGGTDRERVPLARLSAGDLRTLTTQGVNP